MRRSLARWFACAALACTTAAQVDPVTVRVPDAKAWVGQRVPAYVELRAPGSFAGTAGFDLPQLPGTLLLKVGSPVVSSETIDGESWFVQAHEFALFSQSSGELEVPPFAVHFSHREGFTGPVKDVRAEAPGWKVAIERPPESETLGFLVTTDSLELEETWDPEPGPVRVGAMFKRSIVQRASQISGMALAPAPTRAPEGVRVYPGTARTKDRLERGAFLGERREVLTYLLTRPGSVTLPALTYVWWNPRSETLQSKTLPAVTFEVAPAVTAPALEETAAGRRVWPWLLAALLAVALGAWQARSLASWARCSWKRLHPPEHVAARRLLRASGANDAAAAASAWNVWCGTQGPAFQPRSGLRSAVLGLQRTLFGPRPAERWRGLELARSFREHLAASKRRYPRGATSVLPALNPRGREPLTRQQPPRQQPQ